MCSSDLEFAMLDELVSRCREAGISHINGYYYPTAKNGMVRELYKTFGFQKVSEDETGNTQWRLELESYEKQNRFIAVSGNEAQNA